MKNKVFIDSNIFLYSLTKPKDSKEIEKREASLNLLSSSIELSELIISIQVLNEIHYNFVKKFKIIEELAKNTIQENIIKIASIANLTIDTYKSACELRNKYNFSYWDSLIMASALESKCLVLYTEDMQNNQIIENQLTIINPFIK